MNDKIEIGNRVSAGVFYKCPVGGFASLRPGVCPKCREPLVLTGTAKVSDGVRRDMWAPKESELFTREGERRITSLEAAGV